jgi:hypothetical protein
MTDQPAVDQSSGQISQHQIQKGNHAFGGMFDDRV